jgi:hypothetical protein
MKRRGLFRITVGLCIVVSAACGRQADETSVLEAEPTVYGDENLVPPRLIIAEGCLTAAGDRFVLTELEGGVPGPTVADRSGARPWAANEPTTEIYRLVDMEKRLRPLVGQRVEITGEAEPEQVVDTREISPWVTPLNERPIGTADREPHVSAITTTRIEISDLRVRSVRPTGDRCLAARR